jgi:hypothetical protein
MPLMDRRSIGTLLLIPAIMLGACHRSPPVEQSPADEMVEDTGPIALHVENHHFNDIVVHLGHSGALTRLGTARGLAHTELTFPSAYARNGNALVLVAAPIGSNERFTSEAFFVQSGQEVSWTLEARLVQSSLSVR